MQVPGCGAIVSSGHMPPIHHMPLLALCRRSLVEGSNPRGGDSPYVSAEGHAIVDIRFCEWASALPEASGLPEASALPWVALS